MFKYTRRSRMSFNNPLRTARSTSKKFFPKNLGQFFFGSLISAPISGVKMLRVAIGPGFLAGVVSQFAAMSRIFIAPLTRSSRMA
jgi:hypothetical protein